MLNEILWWAVQSCGRSTESAVIREKNGDFNEID